MRETTLQVQVPAELMGYGLGPEDIQRSISEWLVFSLFTDGRISSGKAASLLAMHRIEFLALLRRRGIAYVDMTNDELAEEFAATQALEVDPKS